MDCNKENGLPFLHLMSITTRFLLPANEGCEGYVFTPVCHSVHRGSASVHDGIADPLLGTDPSGGRPHRSRHLPGADPLPSTVHAGRDRQHTGSTHPI